MKLTMISAIFFLCGAAMPIMVAGGGAVRVLRGITNEEEEGDASPVVRRRLKDTAAQTVRIAEIFDTKNFDWGEELFEFVVDMLNNHSNGFHDDLLDDGTKIEYLIGNSACNGITASEAYWDIRTQWNNTIDGVVGCRCSSASTVLATLASLEEVPMISPSSTSAVLSSPGYRTFSRTVSPDTERGQVGALVAMLRKLGWKRVSIITSDKPYARDLSAEFQRLWVGDDEEGVIAYNPPPVKIDPETDRLVSESVAQALQGVPTDDPTNNSRIILLFAHNEHAYQILRAANEINFQPDSVWVGPQAWVGRLPSDTSWMPPVPGYVGVTPFRNDDSVYQDFLERIRDLQRISGREMWTNLPDYAAEYMVDAILALVTALSSLSHEQRSDGALVTSRLRGLDLDGVSGEVRFTEEGNRRDPKFTVFNLQRTAGGELIWKDFGSVTVDSEMPSATTAEIDTTQMCFARLACGEVPLDMYPFSEPKDPIVIWAPIVISVVILALLAVLFKLWRSKMSKIEVREKLKQTAKQLEKQMQGMVQVVHDMPIRTAEEYEEKIDLENQTSLLNSASWYWLEDGGHIGKHKACMVLPNTNFVGYPHEISGQVEHAFQLWKEESGFSVYDVDLDGKVEKIFNSQTGLRYKLDFVAMKQENAKSLHKRTIQRVESANLVSSTVALTLPPLPVDIDFSAEGGEVLLPTIVGQIIQISKVHPTDSEWAYGNILYDPLLHDVIDQQPKAASSGLNAMLAQALHDRPTSGWFPRNAVSTDADVNVMQKLLGSWGGEGISDLSPPPTWDTDSTRGTVAALNGRVNVSSSSAEYREVADYFTGAMFSQRDQVIVTGVERVQNLPLWQTYAVKRQTIKTRDTKAPEHRLNNPDTKNFEHKWLFHGTTHEVSDKIEKQGFNRAFAGRNAVAYGKGVYFARDAAYSSHEVYSTPDNNGVQRMFLCRVCVGDWCKGMNGQLTPSAKPHSQFDLFDSTVDNVQNPSIFVVYHDSQAYPEYLVSFKKRQ